MVIQTDNGAVRTYYNSCFVSRYQMLIGMRKIPIIFVTLLVLLFHPYLHAYELVSVNYPNSIDTRIFGNDEHNLVGWYEDAEGFHGFLYDGINWTSLDFPGATSTKARGIDGKTVVGLHVKDGLNGFIYDGDNWVTLRYPGSLNTMAFGVNGDNVVGEYKDASGNHGFLYNGSNWVTLNYPGAVETHARNIDEKGNIVGWYVFVNDKNIRRTRGFVYDGTNWTSLLYPGSHNSSAFDIVGGKIVGSWIFDDVQHGFIYDGVNWTAIDVPGALGTRVRGLDSRGNISGWFWDDSGNHGFTGRISPNYKFVTLDYPGVGIHTYIHSIDQLRVVGLYREANNNNRKHGFVYDGRKWTSIDYPDSNFTEVLGIDGQNLVGSYQVANEYEWVYHGFLHDDNDWTALDFPIGMPGEVTTRARGIDGQNIVGFYRENLGALRGFLYDGLNWTTLMYPGSANTTAFAIDGLNIVGTHKDSLGLHGFLYDGSNWSTIDYNGPGASDSSSATSISGRHIVGWYEDTDLKAHGFIYDFGNIIPVDYPGALKTVLRGVDDDGNIVGWYRDASYKDRGFIAIPMPLIAPPPTFGYPSYDPGSEQHLFVWNNKGTPNWHVRVTAGGGSNVRYKGTITTSAPLIDLIEKNLEPSDLVAVITPNQIIFDLSVISQWQDGFDFSVPVGSTVQLELNDNTTEARDLVQIGGYRWPANELPIELTN